MTRDLSVTNCKETLSCGQGNRVTKGRRTNSWREKIVYKMVCVPENHNILTYQTLTLKHPLTSDHISCYEVFILFL